MRPQEPLPHPETRRAVVSDAVARAIREGVGDANLKPGLSLLELPLLLGHRLLTFPEPAEDGID